MKKVIRVLFYILILLCSLIQGFKESSEFSINYFIFFIVYFLIIYFSIIYKLSTKITISSNFSLVEKGIFIFFLTRVCIGIFQSLNYFDFLTAIKANINYTCFLMYPILYEILENKKHIVKAYICTIISAFLLSYQAFLKWKEPLKRISEYRLQGTEFTDIFYIYGLAICLGFLFFSFRSKKLSFQGISSFLFFIIGFIYFSVRTLGSINKMQVALWIIALIMVLFLSPIHFRKKIFILLILFLCGIFIFKNSDVKDKLYISYLFLKYRYEHTESSIEKRISEYKIVWECIKRRPLLGYGAGFKYSYYRPGTGFESYGHVHNFLLNYALIFGLPCALLILFFIIQVLFLGFYFFNKDNPIFISSFLIFIFVISISLFQTYLNRIENIFMFLLSAIVILKIARKEIR